MSTITTHVRVGDHIVYMHNDQRSSAVAAGVGSPDTLLVMTASEDDLDEIPRASVVEVARDDDRGRSACTPRMLLVSHRLTTAQFDGLACIRCGCSFAETGVPSVPIA